MRRKPIFSLDPDQLERLLSIGTGGADPQEGHEHHADAGAGTASGKPNPPSQESQSTNVTASLVGLEQPGGRIGRYKLLRILGEGGMGMVYLAEQEGQIRRKVALKVIKPGMDSHRVIARFEAERQALALLDHPSIAQVYDAGTTDAGRPYFVMEHVKGSPITDYCDRHKLSIEDRLRLFQQVCLAVHHAHQKGIIHRDLKPSNILVSAENDQPTPKIIDFGVAKAMSQPLTERTLFTEDNHLLGTPEYMSPEQAEMVNEDIDIRSDIYSLGVLLYVLLAGILPYDSETLRQGGIEHIRKTIRETNPKTPSTRLAKLGEEAGKLAESRRTEVATLARRLHQELEWIPLKAMRKDRAERYRSAVELADDIGHYLGGEPLIAGPPGTMYRLTKFVQRNRALVTGVVAAVVALTAGLIVSTVFYLQAEQASAEAQATADFLTRDVLDAARRIRGRDATVLDALDAASQNVEYRFVDEPMVEASIRETLGRIYWDLGDYRGSVPQRERAYRIYLAQLGEKHADTERAMNWLAVSYNFTGQAKEAEMLWDRLLRQHGSTRPGFKCNLAVAYARQGRYEQAEQLFRKTFETAGWGPDHYLTLLYSWDLAKVYREQGRYAEAEELFVRTLKGQRQKYGKKAEGDTLNWMTIRCMNELARLYVIQGHYDQAEALFTEGIEIGESQLPGKDHPFMLRHVNGLGALRTRQHRYDDAEALFNRALEGRKRKLGEDHPETLETITDLGVLRREQEQYEEAGSLLRQALEGRQRKLGNDHPACFESMHELGVLYLQQARYADAEPLLLDAFHGREAKLGLEHPRTLASLGKLVHLYESWPKPDEAAKCRARLPEAENATESN